MKKTAVLLLSVVLLTTSAVSCGETEKPVVTMPFEDVMRSAAAGSEELPYASRTIFYSLQEYFEEKQKFPENSPTLVVIEPIAVRYFVERVPSMSWTDGRAVYEVKIRQVVSEMNAAGFEVGDTAYISQRWTIRMKNSDEWYPYLSAKLGVPFEDYWGWESQTTKYTLEVVPEEGVEYVKIVPEHILPMLLDKTYAALVYPSASSAEKYDEDYGKVYNTDVQFEMENSQPISPDITHKYMYEEYGFELAYDFRGLNRELYEFWMTLDGEETE